MNEQIKILYKGIIDKSAFKECLALKLDISLDAVEHNLAKKGHFKEKHLKTVLHWIEKEYQLQQKYKYMRVVDWEVVK